MAAAGVCCLVCLAVFVGSYLDLVPPLSITPALFAAVFLTFGPTVFLIRSGFSRQVASWTLLGTLPPLYLIVGAALFVWVAFNFFSSVTQLDGSPEQVGGQYVLRSHGQLTPITPEQYQHYQSLEARLFAGHGMIFEYVTVGLLLAYTRVRGTAESDADESNGLRPLSASAGPQYEQSRGARLSTWGTVLAPITAGVMAAAMLLTLLHTVTPSPVFLLGLLGILGYWVVRSWTTLQEAVSVDVNDTGLRARRLLGLPREILWSDVASLREHRGLGDRIEQRSVDLIGQNGRPDHAEAGRVCRPAPDHQTACGLTTLALAFVPDDWPQGTQ